MSRTCRGVRCQGALNGYLSWVSSGAGRGRHGILRSAQSPETTPHGSDPDGLA